MGGPAGLSRNWPVVLLQRRLAAAQALMAPVAGEQTRTGEGAKAHGTFPTEIDIGQPSGQPSLTDWQVLTGTPVH